MTTPLRPRVGLIAGPLIFAILMVAPAPQGLSPEGWRTAAVGLLMATWWITEAIPIPVTALLPIVCFPLLGVGTVETATAPYANSVIFLFLGGFLIALALERTGLHRRAALATLAMAGTRPAALIFAFMAVTAFLSMWVSNTATVMMMLPMALAVIALAHANDGDDPGTGTPFDSALLLGIAYAATIGGIGTLIGTPPNALFAAFMAESYDIRIGFAEWMVVGVPVVLLTLPITWWLLTRVVHRLDDTPISGGAAMLASERAALGPMSREEWFVGAVTALAALSWMSRPLLVRVLPALSDPGIAVAAAVILFAVPVGWRPLRHVMRWNHVERLPWAVLLLFGGGLSLAAAIQSSGLAEWVGLRLGSITDWPLPAMITLLVVTVIVLSEFASNTAVTAAFLPIVATVATGGGGSPMLPALATAMAASAGFMLPVSTPPNAIVYGTDRITIGRMAASGGLVDLLFVMVLPPTVLLLGAWVFGR